LRLQCPNYRSNDGGALLFSINTFFKLFLPSGDPFHPGLYKAKHEENNSLILFPVSSISDFFCFRFLTYYYEAVRAHRPGFPVYARDHYGLFFEALKKVTPLHNEVIRNSPFSAEAEQARKRIRSDEIHLKKLLLAENEVNRKVSSIILPGVHSTRSSALSFRYFCFDLSKFNFHSSSCITQMDRHLTHAEIFNHYDWFIVPDHGYRERKGFTFYGFDGPKGLQTVEQVLEKGLGGRLLFTCHIALKRTGTGSPIPFLNYSVFTK